MLVYNFNCIESHTHSTQYQVMWMSRETKLIIMIRKKVLGIIKQYRTSSGADIESNHNPAVSWEMNFKLKKIEVSKLVA